MKNIYERVLELMGKTQDDRLFAQFLSDLGEDPVIYKKDEVSTEYMFEKSGFALSFMEVSRHSSRRGFAHAFFYLRSPSRPTYDGKLPGGIKPDDDRDDVERKLGLKPISSKLVQNQEDSTSLWENYYLKPYKLCFIFQLPNYAISMLSVHYSPSKVPAQSTSNS